MTEEKTPAEICGGLSALKEEKWKQKGKKHGNERKRYKNQMFLLERQKTRQKN